MPQYDRFQDDLDLIPDDAVIYRRLSWHHLGGIERHRGLPEAKLSDNGFRDYTGEKARAYGFPGDCFSVCIASMIPPATPLREIAGEFGLARSTAGAIRRVVNGDGHPFPLWIMHAPTDEEPWHGVVSHPHTPTKPKSIDKALVRLFAWEIALVAPEAAAPLA
jgi:hypothetical protein